MSLLSLFSSAAKEPLAHRRLLFVNAALVVKTTFVFKITVIVCNNAVHFVFFLEHWCLLGLLVDITNSHDFIVRLVPVIIVIGLESKGFNFVLPHFK
jgi:hypothetical protein